MFLKNIRLTNFKCHDSLVVDFSAGRDSPGPVRKTTFLVGENGTGKTALLQAIAFITGGSEALRYVPGMPDAFIQLRKRFCSIQATIVSATGEELSVELRLDRGQSPGDVAASNRAGLATLDTQLRKGSAQYFTAGYGAERRLDTGNAGQPKRKRLFSRYEAISSLFREDRLLRSLDQWPPELLQRGGAKVVQTMRDALRRFLPPELRFLGIDKSSQQLLFATPDGKLPLGALSHGHQQMIAWVGDLLYLLASSGGGSGNPLASGGLLLIDEIDLHLHPSMQRSVHAFLADALPNFQVIASTNSALTAQQADVGELYALRRNELGRIELLPFSGDPTDMLLHQLLMSPMFGLDTDESIKVANAKARAREKAISGTPKGPTASSQRRAAESLTTGPTSKLNVRSNSNAEPEDLSLLQQINAALLASGKRKPQ